MNPRIAVLSAAFVVSAQPMHGAPADKESATRIGREVVSMCASGNAKGVVARFDATMTAALTVEALKKVLGGTLAEGKIGRRLREGYVSDGTYDTYIATHQYGSRTMVITVSLDRENRVAGLFFRPSGIGADPKAGYRTKTTLRLPFNGAWWVFWGGTTVEQNYHVASRDQRHAYDIVIRREGRSHRGDGKRNEDYYAFGQEVLAPANGTIVTAVDGVRDNVPGQMNPAQLRGNHVVIDFGNGEFASICHFKKGSLRVKPGERVRSGQVLGLCGNSGNSSEAHIHFHLQDRKEQGPTAVGLPSPFTNYFADDRLVPKGVPTRGQQVRPKSR